MWILNIILFIFILGIIILVHEFGHFIWAKKFGVYIYEFSIGMGPVIHTHKGRDGIDYNIRAFPIGGFVSMAGEVYEDNSKIKKEKFMCNKPWLQRVIILIAGVMHNFILAIVLLFFIALFYGSTTTKPIIGAILEDSAISKTEIEVGDQITAINGIKSSSWDKLQIALYRKNNNDYYEFTVKKASGEVETYQVVPEKVKNEDGTESNKFGFGIDTTKAYGFIPSIKYAFSKFGSIISSMTLTITSLFTGKISLSALSGPVGIYQVVETSVSVGLSQVLYIIAFLSINVGYINILPFPAFDGGRVLFLIIEKIKRSPVNSKIENAFHTVGFILLMILMIYITIQDILKLI
jgi:regulator of sigma E protease